MPELCAHKFVIVSSGMECPETYVIVRMHGVPAREGVATRCGAINTTPDARQTIRQLTYRYCRSFAGITRVLVSIDDCGSIHKVAGSHTTERHFCTHVCSCVLVSLGFAIWCAIYIDK